MSGTIAPDLVSRNRGESQRVDRGGDLTREVVLERRGRAERIRRRGRARAASYAQRRRANRLRWSSHSPTMGGPDIPDGAVHTVHQDGEWASEMSSIGTPGECRSVSGCSRRAVRTSRVQVRRTIDGSSGVPTLVVKARGARPVAAGSLAAGLLLGAWRLGGREERRRDLQGQPTCARLGLDEAHLVSAWTDAAAACTARRWWCNNLMQPTPRDACGPGGSPSCRSGTWPLEGPAPKWRLAGGWWRAPSRCPTRSTTRGSGQR